MTFFEHLRAALADRYTIERELGGGGMSRVFLATEIALGRRVVLKLVPPELAASVSTERFRREMLLVAQLQHTNIVPVLSAGDIDGTLYYSMPFVEGESLRARLESKGTLPIDDVVAITADVLRALAYAHRRGIVHRDIKPDNILLADGGAVVADFGIAKALGDATGESGTAGGAPDREDDGALTQTGVIVGTPAYLAPEQAAPGSVVDARTDLYALGCVMYEMLAGERVFPGLPPQREMLAHITTAAPAVASKRADVRRDLGAFVARLLEKDPDKRPANADEALRELEQARPHRRRKAARWTSGAVAAVAIAMIAAYAVLPKQLLASARTLMTRRPAVLHVNRAVVVPFENQTGDPKGAALGALVADWIGEGLSRLPNLEVVDSRTTLLSGVVVKRIPKLLRARDDARAIAEETGAKVLVTGTIYRDGDTLTLRSRIVDASTGALMQALPEVTASNRAPGPGIDELRRRIVATLRGASDTSMSYMPGMYSPPPSVEAYDEMHKGLEGYFSNDPHTFDHLRAAIRLDSTYAAPLVFAAFASSVRVGLGAADSVARIADRLRDRMTPAEQAMLDYVHALVDGDPAASTSAAQRFMNVSKGSMEAPLLAASNAVATFHPQLALDALARSDPDRGMNLAGPFYWMYRAEAARQLGDHRGFLAAAREGQKRFPGSGSSAYCLTLALVDAGRLDELRDLMNGTRDPMVGAAMGASATAELMQAGRDGDARQFAAAALARLPAENAFAPADSTKKRLTSNVRAVLLLETEQWSALDSLARRLRDTTLADPRRLFMTTLLAIALVHENRPVEAKAIDDMIAAQHPKYSRADYIMARASIAAHQGRKAEAAALLDDALRNGYKLQFAGTNLAADPTLIPLRGFPAFVALLKRGA